MSTDLITLGEAMLRLSVPVGSRLENAHQLRLTVGGAEANVAVALARMGRSSSWVSRLPDSPLGRRVGSELASHGVDLGHVRWVEGARLGTYFVELSAPPRPIEVIYDREGSAASAIGVEDVPWDEVETAGVVHLTGITPALSASCRETCLEVARHARAASVPLTFDVNYRAALWAPERARDVLSELCSLANVVVVAERDARTVFELDGDPIEMVGRAQDLFGAESVVLTRGRDGCSWRFGEDAGELAALPATVIDRIGAGDAFAAGVILGVLEGDLRRGVEVGRAMAALQVGIEGDQFRAGVREVARLMSGEPGHVRR
jgi:2-dehydro-3-deoxygluconokinase